MKIFLLITLLSIVSCQDQLKSTDVQKEVVTTPTLCPEPPPSLKPSNIKFKGLETSTNITNTSVQLNWKHIDGLYQYHVITLKNENGKEVRNIIKTLNAPASSTVISELTPDTEYHFLVRAIDQTGSLDQNFNIISIKTKPWPNFANRISLKLNGSQSIALPDSKLFMNNNMITVSIWFKIGKKADSDQRLFTFHSKDFSVNTALSLGVEDDKLRLQYLDQNNNLIQKSIVANYFDSSWHHVALTYNAKNILLYFDGSMQFNIKDKISQFGEFPAQVGSYAGILKAFIGHIDELAIFNKGLDQGEITELYNSNKSSDLTLLSTNNHLQSWYRFGDDFKDSDLNIEDVKSGLNGKPLNIISTDFEEIAP